MLSVRRTKVLDALINEYVSSMMPVSSSRLAECYLPDVSAATIRNELFGLESDGLAYSPHTSSGRIPTNSGFRLFVSRLLLVPRDFSVTSEGGVERQQLWQKQIKAIGFYDFSQSILEPLLALCGQLAFSWCPTAHPVLVVRGLSLLLRHPEFRDAELLAAILTLVESQSDLVGVVEESLGQTDFAVRIGLSGEGPLSSCALIARRVSYQPTITFGLIGPTRMDYRQAMRALGSVT
ncbi:MAG: hypothetical protein FWF71_02970 [Actinomycetia bacterium]|nr:hypothetical protein [Actinomycetes bacterium]